MNNISQVKSRLEEIIRGTVSVGQSFDSHLIIDIFKAKYPELYSQAMGTTETHIFHGHLAKIINNAYRNWGIRLEKLNSRNISTNVNDDISQCTSWKMIAK